MASGEFTEEEQGRYDRQIRLWGIEAQQRMRNATILVVRLRGTATETIKNIVLAGIGKLILVDADDVEEEDLGAGFFFRDDDVGKKRVDAAKARIENLNPLVTVETVPNFNVLNNQNFESTVNGVDLVCITEWDRDDLVRLNNICRRLRKPFYSGGTYGLLGYIFCDLLDHNYFSSDRSSPKDAPKSIQMKVSYPSLQDALRHRWSLLSKRQTKELNPASVFAILALWQFQSIQKRLPIGAQDVGELQQIADALVSEADVNKQVITTVPHSLIESVTMTAVHEFSPVCAIVGGLLAQDILKTLAAREPPIANFLTFDGNTGGASVCKLSMS
ncbi:hypothetical protein EV368DRAFT_71521 [Lentinula lateritia]|uniref:Uncharacterized protein n=1 Tax=Lentinula aff. lateritia TaxID=2804960 RepID=A0ACC1UCV9_9AGAR|nr:hypothetical protein F5876DRAFT_86274 [Lentinula aff. lateritia]KAJ3856605.1 hypothetical protein EV368DRAFT_71521 [Lentinula lateritia]